MVVNIPLGLNRLDKADNLRKSGDIPQSLRISAMSIELIEFIKSDSSVLPGISRKTIAARVQSALSDAEEMKRSLNLKQQSTSPSSQSESTKTVSKTTLRQQQYLPTLLVAG
jgi:hypothetical protein